MDRLLEKEMVIRVIAVLIAILLWFQATTQQNPLVEKTLDNVTIRVQNVSPGLTLLEDIEPTVVQVRLSGPQHLVANLSARDINTYVNLEGLEPGTHTQTIRFIDPPGVRIIEVTPSTAVVRIEPIVRKTFQLSIVQQGLPAVGHSIGNVSFNPVEVTVEGAESIVSTITNAAVVVDVNNVRTSFERSVAVNVFDELGNVVRGVGVFPSAVEVSIDVVQSQTEKQVPINPSLAGEPAEGYQIAEVILDPQRVTITGALDLIEATESVLTDTIDLSGATETITVSVGLQLPSGIAIVEPTSFRITIRIEEIETPEPPEE